MRSPEALAFSVAAEVHPEAIEQLEARPVLAHPVLDSCNDLVSPYSSCQFHHSYGGVCG